MLRIDFMPRSNDAALEQRECRFNGVRMNVAVCVLARVINRAMLIRLHLIECPRIDCGFVSYDHFNMAPEIRVDNVAHRGRGRILGPNQPQIAVALSDADYDLLDALWTPAALLATYVGFVYLYGAAKRLWRCFLHGLTDAMAEIPCGLVTHSYSALDLQSRDTLLGLTEK